MHKHVSIAAMPVREIRSVVDEGALKDIAINNSEPLCRIVAMETIISRSMLAPSLKTNASMLFRDMAEGDNDKYVRLAAAVMLAANTKDDRQRDVRDMKILSDAASAFADLGMFEVSSHLYGLADDKDNALMYCKRASGEWRAASARVNLPGRVKRIVGGDAACDGNVLKP